MGKPPAEEACKEGKGGGGGVGWIALVILLHSSAVRRRSDIDMAQQGGKEKKPKGKRKGGRGRGRGTALEPHPKGKERKWDKLLDQHGTLEAKHAVNTAIKASSCTQSSFDMFCSFKGNGHADSLAVRKNRLNLSSDLLQKSGG